MTSRRAESSNPVTRVPVRIRTPSAARRVRHGMRGPVRIEVPVARKMNGPVERVGRDRGHEPAGFLGADDARVEADPAGPAGRPLQFPELLQGRREAQAADRLERAQTLVQLDAVATEPHHRRRRVEGGHETGRLARGAGRQLRLLDEQDVGPAGEGQVVGDAAPGDPASDHHHPGLVDAHERTP